jgi:hypothetical protein
MEWIAWVGMMIVLPAVFMLLVIVVLVLRSRVMEEIGYREFWKDACARTTERLGESRHELHALIAERDEARAQIIFLRNRIEMAQDALKDPPP